MKSWAWYECLWSVTEAYRQYYGYLAYDVGNASVRAYWYAIQ